MGKKSNEKVSIFIRDKIVLNNWLVFAFVLLYGYIGYLISQAPELIGIYSSMLLFSTFPIIGVYFPMVEKLLLSSTANIFHEKIQIYRFIYEVAFLTGILTAIILGSVTARLKELYPESTFISFLLCLVVYLIACVFGATINFVFKMLRFYTEKTANKPLE